MESNHRDLIYTDQVFRSVPACEPEIHCPEIFTVDMMWKIEHSFRNKSVPIYLIRGPTLQGWTLYYGDLLQKLQNYLYQTLFRPYRSDIENGQFLARVVATKGLADASKVSSLVDAVLYFAHGRGSVESSTEQRV